MAIGSDTSLRKAPARAEAPSFAPQRSPKSKPADTGYQAFNVNDRAVSALANNQLAGGVGAGAAMLRSQDRAGISRGRGQQYMADIAETAGLESGRAAAQQTEQGASSANLDARRAYENTRSGERLANQGLLEGLRNSDVMERLARQGRGLDQYETYRRGRFGLDSMRLDYSPLLDSLLR